MGYLIINTKDNGEYRDEMRHKMSKNFRHGMRTSSNYKDEEEMKKVYCEGYEHGYEDAMKELSEGAGNSKSGEFRYGSR